MTRGSFCERESSILGFFRRGIVKRTKIWCCRSCDGFGRSDTREKLRGFFEVDRYHITIAALKALTDKGEFDAKKIDKAIAALEELSEVSVNRR